MRNFINIILISTSLLFFSLSCRNSISDSNDNQSHNSLPYEGIIISKPSVGEIWKPGEEHTIEWSKSNLKKVNIILLKKKQYHKLVIKQNIANTGLINWQVPEEIPLSVSYQIKLENSENPAQFFYSEVFEISNR